METTEKPKPKKYRSQKQKDNHISRFLPNEECEQFDGHRALFRAKILQHLLDLISKAKAEDTERNRMLAKRFFFGTDAEVVEDFTTVCDLAGYSADVVRRMAYRAMSEGVKWRAAPREGARYEERRGYRLKKKMGTRCSNADS